MQAPERAHGQIVEADFQPHPWLRGPHIQTMLPALLRPPPPLPLQRERLELPDGDFVDLAWSGPHGASRIAVLVHGLTGGFQSKYLRGLAVQLLRRHWRVVILQLRGGGDEPNRHPRCDHHGDTGDLRHLWRVLRQRHPDARLATVGWSLGANVLLKALGEEGDAAPLSVAAAGCAPFQLDLCAEKLRTGSARVYQARLLADLKVIARRKHAAVPAPPPVNIRRTLAARDFFEFDDAYTAPMNGFRDARDYYARCACGQFLRDIRRPTLIVNAKDDPFMTPQVLPTPDQLSPWVTLEVARCGGHVGFVAAGRGGVPSFWLEHRLAHYLEQSLPA